MVEKFTSLAQLEKLARMSMADSAARVAGLAELLAAGLADSQSGLVVTLPAANWIGGVQTVQNEFLLADSSYWYFVSSDMGVWADNVTENGKIVFHCDSVPEVDLTAHILRLEAETNEGKESAGSNE